MNLVILLIQIIFLAVFSRPLFFLIQKAVNDFNNLFSYPDSNRRGHLDNVLLVSPEVKHRNIFIGLATSL